MEAEQIMVHHRFDGEKVVHAFGLHSCEEATVLLEDFSHGVGEIVVE
jgi:hypothetical protein